MSTAPEPARVLVPAGENSVSSLRSQLPEILTRAGKAAVFAADEFFYGRIRNEHTRAAYLHAVKQFLLWAEAEDLELVTITPKDVGQYLDRLRNKTSVSTSKQHLAGLAAFL